METNLFLILLTMMFVSCSPSKLQCGRGAENQETETGIGNKTISEMGRLLPLDSVSFNALFRSGCWLIDRVYNVYRNGSVAEVPPLEGLPGSFYVWRKDSLYEYMLDSPQNFYRERKLYSYDEKQHKFTFKIKGPMGYMRGIHEFMVEKATKDEITLVGPVFSWWDDTCAIKSKYILVQRGDEAAIKLERMYQEYLKKPKRPKYY